MREGIQNLIQEIEDEFSRLKEATAYIDSSKEAVQTVIQQTEKVVNEILNRYSLLETEIKQTVEKLQELGKLSDTINGINFPERLDNIYTSLVQMKDSILNDQKKILEAKFSSQENLFNQKVNNILNQNKDFFQKVESFYNLFKDVNFLSRFDKIDNTISGIYSSSQTILQRLETLERNIKESLENRNNQILTRINSIENIQIQKLNTTKEELSTENKLLKVLLVVNLLLSGIILIKTLNIF